MDPFIIAIVGMCGSGKSVAAGYIDSQKEFKSIYYGGYVLEEVKNRNLEINSVNEKFVREDLRKLHGPDVMAKKSIKDIDAYLGDGFNTVIDGLYSFSEYLYLKKIYEKKLNILAIHTAKNIRYERLGGRKVRPLTPKQVDDRDFFEIQNIEKAGPIAIADYHIVNDGSIEDLNSNLDNILNQLNGR